MNERRLVLAVDCDDVVTNISDGLRQFVNETYGTKHTSEEYRVTGAYKRYWERIWGIPDDEDSDRFPKFVASGRMAKLDEVTGAIEGLKTLKKYFRLVMVTARSEREMDYTHTWLENHAPNLFDNVTFMHLWHSDDKKATKAEICKQLGADYLIDDNYDHCRIATELGIQTLLFGNYGWNRDVQLIKNMTRVYDWNAVTEFFDDQRG